jgi:hypothetical protein
MSDCCNNVKITRTDETGCACVFKCNDEPGARVLGKEITLADQAAADANDMVSGMPVFTMDGDEWLPLTAAKLIHGSALGYGIVTCGADLNGTFPFKFKPEVVTAGSYWIDNVVWPGTFTDADKKKTVLLFRAHKLSGTSVYAPYAA